MRGSFLFPITVAMLCAPSALAEDSLAEGALAELRTRETLTGDWGGLRSGLEERGLTLEFAHTLDVMSVVDGGRARKTETLGSLDLVLAADLEALLGWRGASFAAYGIVTWGGRPSDWVGDLQAVDNIEDIDTVRLFEAWFQKQWFDGRLSALAGLYDVNSEFDVIPAASVFVHSSHGQGAEFGNAGRNGPSAFPATSLALRLEARPQRSLYARAVVADGVPGDLDDPGGTRIRFDDGDGLLLAGEIGLLHLDDGEPRRPMHPREGAPPGSARRRGHFGKLALGAWGFTGRQVDVASTSDPPQTSDGTWGVYLLAQQRVYHEANDPERGLSLFLRLGIADDRNNRMDAYLGGGIVYQGLLSPRKDDDLGLAVAAAHLSHDFRSAQAGRTKHWETALELTYQARLAPWLSLQPNLQVVFHPSGSRALETAVVLGGRIIIAL